MRFILCAVRNGNNRNYYTPGGNWTKDINAARVYNESEVKPSAASNAAIPTHDKAKYRGHLPNGVVKAIPIYNSRERS